jgi:hypothetical protein
MTIHTFIRLLHGGRMIAFRIELCRKLQNPLGAVFDAIPTTFTAILQDVNNPPGNLYIINI